MQLTDGELVVGLLMVVGFPVVVWFVVERSLQRRRQALWKRIARRVGLSLQDDPWVRAKVGDSELIGREYEVSRGSGDMRTQERYSEIRAEVPGELPEYFAVSRDSHTTGVLRAKLHTSDGKAIYVRGKRAEQVEELLDEEWKSRLIALFDAVPRALLEEGKLRVREKGRIDARAIEDTLRAFRQFLQSQRDAGHPYRDAG